MPKGRVQELEQPTKAFIIIAGGRLFLRSQEDLRWVRGRFAGVLAANYQRQTPCRPLPWLALFKASYFCAGEETLVLKWQYWGPSGKLEWNGTWYSRSWANMSDSCSPSFRSHLFYHLSHHISGIKSRKEENYWDTAGRYGSLMQGDVNERT